MGEGAFPPPQGRCGSLSPLACVDPTLDGSINPPVRVDTPLERAISPLPKNIEGKTTRSSKIFEGFQGTFYKKFPEWGLGQRPK